jgi:hypothetical protein
VRHCHIISVTSSIECKRVNYNRVFLRPSSRRSPKEIYPAMPVSSRIHCMAKRLRCISRRSWATNMVLSRRCAPPNPQLESINIMFCILMFTSPNFVDRKHKKNRKRHRPSHLGLIYLYTDETIILEMVPAVINAFGNNSSVDLPLKLQCSVRARSLETFVVEAEVL